MINVKKNTPELTHPLTIMKGKDEGNRFRCMVKMTPLVLLIFHVQVKLLVFISRLEIIIIAF